MKTDAELWTESIAGSHAAFATLFDRHADKVYNYCFRRIGDWAEAEDLVAAAFAEAWRRRDRVHLHGDSLLPWLLGVATNLTHGHFRAAVRRRRVLERLADIDSEPDPADEVVERLADEGRMRAILEEMARLRPAEQQVINLCVWTGLDYQAAAVALGVPIGTVRSRLSRARNKLRASLYDPDNPRFLRSHQHAVRLEKGVHPNE